MAFFVMAIHVPANATATSRNTAFDRKRGRPKTTKTREPLSGVNRGFWVLKCRRRTLFEFIALTEASALLPQVAPASTWKFSSF